MGGSTWRWCDASDGYRFGEWQRRWSTAPAQVKAALAFRALSRWAESAAELRRVMELNRLIQRPDSEAGATLLAEVEAELAKQSG
jgi:hypothetical protein